MMLDKKLRILHLDPQAIGRDCHTVIRLKASETSKPAPCDTLPPTILHLVQQGHTPHKSVSLYEHVGSFSFSLTQQKPMYKIPTQQRKDKISAPTITIIPK